MESETNIQHNKLIYLEDSVVMYGVYNTETLEKHIETVHHIHNTKTLHEKIIARHLTMAYRQYINPHSNWNVQHYAINLLLYL